jgi:hypothetical protein
MTGNSRKRSANVLVGRWRISEIDLWKQDDIDLVVPNSSSSARTSEAALHLSPSKEGSTGEWLPGMGSRAQSSRGKGLMRAIPLRPPGAATTCCGIRQIGEP